MHTQQLPGWIPAAHSVRAAGPRKCSPRRGWQTGSEAQHHQPREMFPQHHLTLPAQDGQGLDQARSCAAEERANDASAGHTCMRAESQEQEAGGRRLCTNACSNKHRPYRDTSGKADSQWLPVRASPSSAISLRSPLRAGKRHRVIHGRPHGHLGNHSHTQAPSRWPSNHDTTHRPGMLACSTCAPMTSLQP